MKEKGKGGNDKGKGKGGNDKPTNLKGKKSYTWLDNTWNDLGKFF